ncbi:hypothetical protein J6590_099124 [Homalodisca vitripennis]|nr:hypothetical protein J6590_099124 [Homalodisca vitripennis]
MDSDQEAEGHKSVTRVNVDDVPCDTDPLRQFSHQPETIHARTHSVYCSPLSAAVPSLFLNERVTAPHPTTSSDGVAQHNACVEHELRSDNQSSTGGRREAFGNLLLYWPNFTSGLVVYTFTPVTFSLLPNLAWVQ